MITPCWAEEGWIAQTQLLLDSFARLLGYELIPRTGSATEQSEQLFAAPFVVLSHGTQEDPVFNYGNQTALDLWEVDLATHLATPSRLSAEPVHRDERVRLLQRTTRDGFVDDYRGVRISHKGRRFMVERAIVWNLHTSDGAYAGQGATFGEWTFLD